MAESGQVFKKEYSINMDLVTPQTLLHFQLAGHMLPIINETDSSKKITLHEFPGHGINGLVVHYKELTNVVKDKKSACTVIEYWDSKNERPLAWLYPTGRICASSHKLESDMNAATYADLQQQLKLRNNWMQTIRNSK